MVVYAQAAARRAEKSGGLKLKASEAQAGQAEGFKPEAQGKKEGEENSFGDEGMQHCRAVKTKLRNANLLHCKVLSKIQLLSMSGACLQTGICVFVSNAEPAANAPPRKMVTLLMYGDQKAIEIAERMIFEAVANK